MAHPFEATARAGRRIAAEHRELSAMCALSAYTRQTQQRQPQHHHHHQLFFYFDQVNISLFISDTLEAKII